MSWVSILVLSPAAIGTDVFDVEKPVVFTYEDIMSSTDGFSDSNLLGHGTYGSVYYGVLHDQVWDHMSSSDYMLLLNIRILFPCND